MRYHYFSIKLFYFCILLVNLRLLWACCFLCLLLIKNKINTE